MTTTHKAVTDGNGKFLGRFSMGDSLGWVGAAHASCFADEGVAKAAAEQFGGAVVNAPKWNDRAKAYVVPA